MTTVAPIVQADNCEKRHNLFTVPSTMLQCSSHRRYRCQYVKVIFMNSDWIPCGVSGTERSSELASEHRNSAYL